MNDFFEQIREQVTRVWNQLNLQQKVIFIAAPVMLLVALGVAVYLAGRPQMENLMTGDPAEIGRIKNYLQENNIEFNVVDERTIQVDSDIRPSVMMDLATEGLVGPDFGPTFEIFDTTRFGMTDKLFNLNERRALQNKLSKVIVNGSNNIQDADVTLAIPERELFSEDQKEHTAMVKIVARGSVSQQNVEGIQRLVAMSVPGMRFENVVVLDNNNNLLSEDSEIEPGVKAASKQMQLQTAIENDTKRKIERLLQTWVGPSNYVVTVNAVLDWTKMSVEKVEMEVENPAVVSSKVYEEKNESKGIAGPPGVVSNVQDTGIGTEGELSTTTITDEVQNTQYPWWHTMIDEAQGEVTQLHVSVLLNYHEDANGTMVAWAPQELADFQRQIEVAAGLSGTLENTSIDIQSHLFDTSAASKETREKIVSTITSIVQSLIPLILLFALGYFAYVFFQRAFAPPEIEEEELPEEIPIEPVADAKELTLSQLGLAEFGDIASLPAEEQRRIKMQEHVINYAAEKPEEVAAIIKAWLSS